MSFVDVFGLLVPGSFAALLLVEWLFPARVLPKAPGFRWLPGSGGSAPPAC